MIQETLLHHQAKASKRLTMMTFELPHIIIIIFFIKASVCSKCVQAIVFYKSFIETAGEPFHRS